MKKLMIGLVGALAMVAGADVESTNIVGFMNGESKKQNNFVVVPFDAVGYNTADVQMIKISDGGADTIGYGDEIFRIWEGLPTVVSGSMLTYYEPSADPEEKATDYYWGDEDGNLIEFSIAQGQGAVLNMPAGLELSYAGEVLKDTVAFTSVKGNNFSGNPFAKTIDIQAIKISGGDIGWGDEIFRIWEGVPTVVPGSMFTYYDPSADPAEEATDYYWGDEDGVPASYEIPASQGFVLNVPAGLTISIASPY